MKCPTCFLENKKSCVYPGMSMTTAMGGNTFYDPEGTLHVHDPNTTTTEYRCSNGHNWTESSKSPCPACDYGSAA